jgi:phosphoheptose isomerase
MKAKHKDNSLILHPESDLVASRIEHLRDAVLTQMKKHADVSHVVLDAKGIELVGAAIHQRFITEGKPRFRVIALTDSIPSMLAWANDSCYEDIFIEQLKNLMEPGDVVIGISGSGKFYECH